MLRNGGFSIFDNVEPLIVTEDLEVNFEPPKLLCQSLIL